MINLLQRWRKAKAEAAMAYLILNNHDHDYFINAYDELCDDYRDSVNCGGPVDALTVEKMRSLFDGIAYQIKEDGRRMRRFSQDFREIIASRHVEWRDIQNEIQVMIYPVKLKD